ncbi:hypothetical protein [Streptomyces apocyni]|uniref:hypothetical protein n=1 Tax=Streptomyces apocyni TaxID=2654677 RepID=UPI0012E9A634|nr:hypothetical protein [Streptomyces apocyni]
MAKQKHRKKGGDSHRFAQQHEQRGAEQAQPSASDAPSEPRTRTGDFGEHSKKSKKFGHN